MNWKELNLFIVFIFAIFLVGCLTMSSDVIADVTQPAIEQGLGWEISIQVAPEGNLVIVDSKLLNDCNNLSLEYTGVSTNTDCSSCHWELTDWHSEQV